MKKMKENMSNKLKELPVKMNNNEYIYDINQNKKYSCLVLINMIIGFIFFIIIPIVLIQDGIEIIHNKYTVFILAIFLIVFITNIFFVKKIKLSNAKYYVFKLDNNINFETMKKKLSSIDDRELIEDDLILKRIKLEGIRSKYRLLCYNAKEFDKKIFNKQRSDINKKYNQKYELSFRSKYYVTETREAGRINLIIAGKLNEELEMYMSSNASGLDSRIRSVNMCIVKNNLYIQPIRNFDFPNTISYFKMVEKTYTFLNNIK